jgi:hypothetical protein
MAREFVVNPAYCTATGQLVQNCSCGGHRRGAAGGDDDFGGATSNHRDDFRTLANRGGGPRLTNNADLADALPLPTMRDLLAAGRRGPVRNEQQAQRDWVTDQLARLHPDEFVLNDPSFASGRGPAGDYPSGQYDDYGGRREVRGGSGSGTRGFDELSSIIEPTEEVPSGTDKQYGYGSTRTTGEDMDDFEGEARDRENYRRIYGDPGRRDSAHDDILPVPRMDWGTP